MRVPWQREASTEDLPHSSGKDPIVRWTDFILAHAIEHDASMIAVEPLLTGAAANEWPDPSLIANPSVVDAEREPSFPDLNEEERWGLWFLVQDSWHLVASHYASNLQAVLNRLLVLAAMPYWRTAEGTGSFTCTHRGGDCRFELEHRPSGHPTLQLKLFPVPVTTTDSESEQPA